MSQDQIEDEAARWLSRREQGAWSDADQARLDAWLDTDDAHKIAFWRLEYVWQRVDAAPVATSRAKPARAWVPTRSWVKMSALAACAAACLAVASIGYMALRPATYSTSVGGLATQHLADGSVVELNTDTVLRTEVSATSRRVWLDRGEAYFEIAHDQAHPFVVMAGPDAITVVGTKFSVRRDGDKVRVVVSEGHVRVQAVASRDAPANLLRGDSAVAEKTSVLLLPHSDDQVERRLSWRTGHLVFDQEALGDVADEFNRYNSRKLVVTGQARNIRIGGGFDDHDPAAFARLLQAGFGLHVDEDGDDIKIFE